MSHPEPPSRTQKMSQDEWMEFLAALAAANDEGQIVAVAFMLKNNAGTMVDFRGPMDMAEFMSTTVLERIADHVAVDLPDEAARMREVVAAHRRH
jgi:hypothetical protein